MKIFIVSLLLAIGMLPAWAQDTSTETVQLKNADEVANHLRSEYGINKAVYLTQLAYQLSDSFASTEQLQEQWQQALATDITEPLNFTRINTHALMAQSLIQHTNGMNLNRWRQINIPIKHDFRTTAQPLVNANTFSVWLNLNTYWRDLLKQKSTNMAAWNPWLQDHLDAQNHTKPNSDAMSRALALVISSDPINANNVNRLSEQTTDFDAISVALMRQQYHNQKQQFLAMAYDWIEIYQLLELSPQLLTAEQQLSLASELQQATEVWQSQQASIEQINTELYGFINELLAVLPQKFKNPDHFDNNINNRIFSFITGIDDPIGYFSSPLRKQIQENLEVCLNLSVQQRPEPPVPIADKQFNSCLSEFVDWSSSLSKNSDFAGHLVRLDNTASINRALELPAVQIINHLTAQAAGAVDCQQQLNTRSNWIEWAMAAESIAWFGDRWPALMAEQSVIELLKPIVTDGSELFNYPECVNNNSPLATEFEVVLNKWQLLKQEIIGHVNHFKTTRLAANSDVDLFKSVDQATNYMPEDLVIGPCDVTQSCGAFVELEPNNELLNLFPNHLKLAEQFSLGKLSMCYKNVEWVNRKTVPTHLDNNKIANFSGQLTLQLTGKYQDKDVFTKQLYSQDNHVYLFGENNEDVLNTACPLPLVGKQINTTLDRGTYGLLPNRLTFLTAAKVDINAVIKNNWADWLAQLNKPSDDYVYFDEMNAVKTALNDAFLQQVNNLQQEIYRKLIANNPSRSNDSALSKATFDFTTHRRLLEKMVTGLYPAHKAANPELQAAISGHDRLVDMQFFKQAFESQVNLVDMLNQADENFTKHQTVWNISVPYEPIIDSSLEQLTEMKAPRVIAVKKDAED